MSAELTLSDLFFHPAPPVSVVPHLITLLDGDLIGKISQLTKSRPGLWPLPAPFDENDQYNEVREAAKFADWGLVLNQAEVQGVGRLVKDALFGANLLLMSSAIDEPAIASLAQTQGQRLENGAWFTPGYQDIAGLVKIIELAGWVMIPLGPGRSRALFAVAPEKAAWLDGLQDWCDRQGRDVWKMIRESDAVRLARLPAPAKHRENAIQHRIDSFIGDMELWFGGTNDELASRIQERLDFRQKLRDNIARARQA